LIHKGRRFHQMNRNTRICQVKCGLQAGLIGSKDENFFCRIVCCHVKIASSMASS